MAGNVEIKAVVTSLEAIAEALSRLDAGEGVDLVQEDTFFECPRGRLKLRKIAPGAGELIHYERPDEPGPKSSTYTRVSTTEPDRLCDLLDAAYGTVGVVRKRRTLRLVGRTRVHLDTVEHLGTFVELEVVGGLRAVGAGSSRGTQPDGGAGHRREPARWRRVHRPAAGADLTVSARSRGSGRARPARRTIGGDQRDLVEETTTMREPLRFSGVMPANILPFTADLAIDEPAYRRHLRWLTDTRGVTAVVVNGHASEVSSLTRDERTRSLAIALDEIAGRCPVIAGVYSDGTAEAVDLARDARAAGAAGVLVFPPTLFIWGAQLKPDMAVRHFSEVAAVGLPIVVFEYPPASGIGYMPETLARLAEIPQVAAVKDWSNDIVAFERNLRALRATGRPVAMLSSFTMSLMATFLLGADGAISGMGSVAADLQAELFEACGKGDLDGARRINDRLDPLVRVFYAPPFVDMHNRMKEALALLGRIPAAHVRPPLTPVSPAERESIRAALVRSGLLSR